MWTAGETSEETLDGPRVWGPGDRYELIDSLGHDSAGETWRARNRDTRASVAVRLIRIGPPALRRLVGNLATEWRYLAAVKHPYLVAIHDIVVERDHIGLVTDIVQGRPLRQHLDTAGPLAPATATSMGADIAEALAAAHDLGIAHTAVTSTNVIVGRIGAPVRLTDLATPRLARRLGRSDAADEHPAYEAPAYAAPELINDGRRGTAADIYALGVVLFEMLTGTTPYTGGSTAELLRRHVEAEPAWPVGLPSGLRYVLGRCLQPAPADRPSAAAVAADLRELAAPLGGIPAAAKPRGDADQYRPSRHPRSTEDPLAQDLPEPGPLVSGPTVPGPPVPGPPAPEGGRRGAGGARATPAAGNRPPPVAGNQRRARPAPAESAPGGRAPEWPPHDTGRGPASHAPGQAPHGAGSGQGGRAPGRAPHESGRGPASRTPGQAPHETGPGLGGQAPHPPGQAPHEGGQRTGSRAPHVPGRAPHEAGPRTSSQPSHEAGRDSRAAHESGRAPHETGRAPHESGPRVGGRAPHVPGRAPYQADPRVAELEPRRRMAPSAVVAIAAVAAAAMIGAAVVAVTWRDSPNGQQGAPRDTPTTAATPTAAAPPSLPAAANERSSAGATAFVTYWFQSLSHAVRTGDVAAVSAASSPGCDECQGAMTTVRESYENGGSLRGGDYLLRSQIVSGFPAGNQPTVDVVFDRSPRSTLDADGNIRGALPGASFVVCAVVLEWAGRWRMRAITSSTPIA